MRRAGSLLFALPFLLPAAGCSEEEAPPPQAPKPSLAATEPPAEQPEPPAEPAPRWSAVFHGASADRLRAAGLASPADAPTKVAEPSVAVGSAAPPAANEAVPADGAGDAGPAPAPAVAPAELAGPDLPPEPEDREDDAAWVLPENPKSLVWRHPGPPATLKVTLLGPRGRAWPTRVRLETDGEERVATLTPLTPLPSKALFRLVAEAKGEDGSALLWSEPVVVKAGVDDAPPWKKR